MRTTPDLDDDVVATARDLAAGWPGTRTSTTALGALGKGRDVEVLSVL